MPQRRRSNSCGGVLLEVMAGLVILGALTVVLVSAQARARQGAEALAAQRHALRVAEIALDQIRQGLTPEPRIDDVEVTIEPLENEAPPDGARWVRVRCQYQGQRVQLTGVALP